MSTVSVAHLDFVVRRGLGLGRQQEGGSLVLLSLSSVCSFPEDHDVSLFEGYSSGVVLQEARVAFPDGLGSGVRVQGQLSSQVHGSEAGVSGELLEEFLRWHEDL